LEDPEIVHAVNTESCLWKKGLSDQKKEAAIVSIQAMKKGLEEAKKRRVRRRRYFHLKSRFISKAIDYIMIIKVYKEKKRSSSRLCFKEGADPLPLLSDNVSYVK
jgi:hypothetical protein